MSKFERPTANFLQVIGAETQSVTTIPGLSYWAALKKNIYIYDQVKVNNPENTCILNADIHNPPTPRLVKLFICHCQAW